MTKTWAAKSAPMTSSQLTRWIEGEIPRRHLALPFGGPIPTPHYAKGSDGEGEFFHEGTDFYGPFQTLRDSRDRLVDWHHVTFLPQKYEDPTGLSKGVILGHMVMDEEPSEEEAEDEAHFGVWADLWINAGRKQQAMLRSLVRRGASLYGSSVPVAKAVAINTETGSIDRWPVRYHTISTAPQNTYAGFAPAKASLLVDPNLAELSVGALRAFLTGEDNPPLDPRSTPTQGEIEAKAGRVLSGINEKDLDEAVTALEQALDRARVVLSRHRKEPT